MTTDTSRISPTAHYTGYVWHRNGMSHAALASPLGRRLYRAVWPINLAYERVTRRPGLESMLLARHRVLDHLLERAVDSGEVSQVVEVAAGLSPRGFRFARRYADRGLVYVEGDLPGIVAHKLRTLDGAGLRGDNHHVRVVNALVDSGHDSIDALVGSVLDPERGTAIITEGLLGYFDLATVRQVWARFARFAARFPQGLYLADLVTNDAAGGLRTVRGFQSLLSLFVGGRVHLHFDSDAEAVAALVDAGFSVADIVRPRDAAPTLDIPRRDTQHVRLLAARTARRG